jgi:hypothetical protein
MRTRPAPFVIAAKERASAGYCIAASKMVTLRMEGYAEYVQRGHAVWP